MLHEFLLFLFAVAVGIALRFVYLGAEKLAKSTHIGAVRFVFDTLWCALLFAGLAVFTMFLTDGIFRPYVPLGLLAGLGLGSIIIRFLVRVKRKYVRKKRKKERDI